MIIKNILIRKPLKVGLFHLIFMADEGNKGQHLVLLDEYFENSKIRLNTIQKDKSVLKRNH